VSTLFYELMIAWELLAIVVTLLLSAYLITCLLTAVFAPPRPRRYDAHPKYPMVSIVIPVYNEPPEIVRASIESWKAVRYPAFEIVLADDSSPPLELGDPSVRIVRREGREGFKGGALRHAFDLLDARSEWMVIFDADFLVDPDVLVRFTEHFREGVGAVQGFQAMGRNDPPSYLSRFSEEFHVVANQILAGRHRYGGFVGIQGTVEAYRIAAVREIGGIAPYPTANEDLDTTFRLRKAGWKILYDPRIVGRGVAPERYRVFFVQNTRWTSSTVREYRRHWGSFLRTRSVPAREKVDSAFFLLTWTNSLVVTPTLVFLPWALLSLHLIPLWLSIFITILPLALFTLPLFRGAPWKLALTGWMGYYLLLIPGYFVMFRAVLLGIFTDPGFARTDKTRAGSEASTLSSARYGPRVAGRDGGTIDLYHRVLCAHCGERLTHREVLFYAVGAPDVGAMVCRRCLGTRERRRRAPRSASA